MLKLKYFLAFAIISIASCDISIPERYKNAKPMSEHPDYKKLMQQILPKFSEPERHDPFIVGGSPAQRGDFPHYALMFIIYPDDTGMVLI